MDLAAGILFRLLSLLLFYYPRVIADTARWRLRTSPTVLDVIEGERRFEGGTIAIFLVWQPTQTSWYVRNALSALAEIGANVILVVNHPLTPERIAEFRRECDQIILRDNTGLDFGGYKDAVHHLRDRHDVSRVLFLNDSVYYFERGLLPMLRRLQRSASDVCSGFENKELHYHFGSFCLSVSGDVFRNAEFQRFWREYVPVQSRRWAINKGEIGLSRMLLLLAENHDVIFPAAELMERIRRISGEQRAELLNYLPLWQRRPLAHALSKEHAGEGATAEQIASAVASGSQIHAGGFLFRRFLDSPLLKRDLVYRQQYSSCEIRNLLEAVGHEGHLDEILLDSQRKGSGKDLRGFARGRYGTGLI